MSAEEKKEKILAAFKSGERMLSAQVAMRAGISLSYATRLLGFMAAEGTLARLRTGNSNKHGGSLEFTYCLKQDEIPAPNKTPATPPAYRNLRLTETLTDWGKTNRDFAALCMMVRK
jgi:hypothetical protein